VFPAFSKRKRTSKEWEDDYYLYIVDEWGTHLRMPRHEGKYFDMYRFPLAEGTEEDDAAYVWPEAPSIKPEAPQEVRSYQEVGLLQTGPKNYGFENWLTMLALEEKRVRAIVDKLLERKIEYWDNIFSVLGTSLDIACEMDDLGEQRGPFIGPDMFRKIIKPYYKGLFPYIKKKSGAKLFLHSCGSVAKFNPDLIEAGADILSPVQIGAAGMDPFELKREFGKDLVFWGGGVNT
jgi:uroporphyrinogen decarboxylase